MSSELHVVTGAFGYSGRWIAKQLISEGKQVRTLTNAAARDDPFDGAVEVHQLNFNDYESLVESLRGADVLYNTYWVRYNDNQRNFDHGIAVENCKKLFDAATEAGVRSCLLYTSDAADE